MAKKWKIELPLPPSTAGLTCQSKTRREAKYRKAVASLAAKALGASAPRWPYARVEATFCFDDFTDYRNYDDEGLFTELTPAIEGLVDAGLLVQGAAITHVPLLHRRTRKKPRVLLRIEAWR